MKPKYIKPENVNFCIYEDKPLRTKDDKVFKYVLSYDTLRLVVFSLPIKHKLFSEDTFEYSGNYYTTGEPSEESALFISKLQKESIFELKYGTYKLDRIFSKK